MSEHKVVEVETDLFDVTIDNEVIKVDLRNKTLRKDLENMQLIKEDDTESFHGYLIKSAKEWILKRDQILNKDKEDLL